MTTSLEDQDNKLEAERAAGQIVTLVEQMEEQATLDDVAKLLVPFFKMTWERGYNRGYEVAFLKGCK